MISDRKIREGKKKDKMVKLKNSIHKHVEDPGSRRG